jgi:hypothetical protein
MGTGASKTSSQALRLFDIREQLSHCVRVAFVKQLECPENGMARRGERILAKGQQWRCEFAV